MRMRVWSLVLLSGLRIWCCCRLQCRSQTLLGSSIAVAVVSTCSCGSNSTPSLGNSIHHRCSCKKKRKKKGGGSSPRSITSGEMGQNSLYNTQASVWKKNTCPSLAANSRSFLLEAEGQGSCMFIYIYIYIYIYVFLVCVLRNHLKIVLRA